MADAQNGDRAMTVAALELEHAYRECEQITRREAANFYYGIRLLPRSKRQAMCANYAFARRVDDIGDDGELDRGAQLERLAQERASLAAIAAGAVSAGDPVITALAHASEQYRLPLDALEVLVEGVELDVLGAEYQSFDELVRYCRCVAGSVGRLCLATFTDGSAGEEAHRLADDLGVAMQLTNILRDIVEDRARGRTYIPAEDRERFGCPDLATAGPRELEALIRFEAQRAAQWFDHGMGLVELLDVRSASCVQAMTGIYRRILDRILEDPMQVMRGRISLSPLEKTWVAARGLVAAGGEHLR
ncbi:MAG TPA: squalene/phytoene synthase family protein [Solirubrobacteraceae bacterium]|jgi:phytoene synthase|nr:squalene/phytoene synthase family protein [Solirubrobacteraceae bacterium]